MPSTTYSPMLSRAGLVATLLATLVLAGCGVNTIPTYEQNAKAAWSEVLNQYKRRNDLIPNLVETVKGFADQEKSVLTQVAEARSKASSVQIPADILTNPDAMKKFQDAQNTLGGALRQLLVVAERYPDIKSGQNFLALQSQLEGTENRIAISRRDYISAVRAYLPYVEAELARGTRLPAMTHPLLGLFHGMTGARAWRRILTVEGVKAGAGAEVIQRALEAVIA